MSGVVIGLDYICETTPSYIHGRRNEVIQHGVNALRPSDAYMRQ